MNNKNFKFNILPGFVPNDSFPTLKKYGIKEVYVGFFDDYSEKKWPVAFNTINRRGEGASFYSIDSFQKLDKDAIKNRIDLYIAFNVFYSKEQLVWILKSIKKVSKFNSVKGIIVSDINLLLKLKKAHYTKTIIMSTLSTIFNKNAISFFSELGATRFVLDRQLTAKEVLDIVKSFPQYQFEMFFLLGSGCLFIDGYCSSMHIQEKDVDKKYNVTFNETLCMKTINEQKLNKKLLSYKCNICLLYCLKDLKNITLKIPNRTITDSTCSDIVNTISEIEKNLSMKNINFNKFSMFCRDLFKKRKGFSCNSKICLCRDLFI